jgi:cytochrome c556
MRRYAAVIGSTLTLSLAALAAAPAHAQFAKPQDAVNYRQSAMTLMAAHFGRLVAVARGSAPNDAAQVKENAHVLQMLASLPWPAYGPGMQGGNSKPEVWSDAAGFKQKRWKPISRPCRPRRIRATSPSCAPRWARWGRAARPATTPTASRAPRRRQFCALRRPCAS